MPNGSTSVGWQARPSGSRTSQDAPGTSHGTCLGSESASSTPKTNAERRPAVVIFAPIIAASVERAGAWRFVREYPVMAASGGRGPKLREGDGQVPEGMYTIDWLNPNSSYHLSMHVDYPNAFDRAHAADDGRTALGGAIMIHGRDVS